MNNNSRLDVISSELYRMLNNKLCRINPIFQYEPGKEVVKGHYLVQFPEFKEDLPFEVKEEYRQPRLMWFIFEGLILRSRLTEKPAFPEEYKLILREDCPIHVDCIIEAVRRHSRKSLIQIQDELPALLVINIEPGFKPENERESLIRSLANALLGEGKSLRLQKGIQRIIDYKGLAIKASVQKLLDLAGLGVQGDFSYCLRCGDPVDKLNARKKPNRFCVKPSRANPNNCRNDFGYWQESRLKLTSPEEKKKHSLSLYKELQEIIGARPIDGFGELQKKHPKLYRDGRKNRPTSTP